MRVDRASLFVEAPRERIYKAFIDRDAIVRWLPPAGARAHLDAFEPRPGGAFRMTLVFDDANHAKRKTSENSDTVDGRFVELVPPERIVQQFTFVSEHPEFAGTMTMTWSLAERPSGTLVSVAATDVPLGISPDDHRKGMASSLANLASYMKSSLRADSG